MTTLIEFGWCDFFAQHLSENDQHAPGRVVAEHRSLYRVQTTAGECAAHLAGRLRHQAANRADLPAVGDWVVVDVSPHGEATIQHVLPRKTKLSRKVVGEQTEEQILAANVDTVWIVTSLDGDFSLRRIERYLSVSWESGAAAAIVLTKADLCSDRRRHQSEVEAIAIGTPIHVVSAVFGEGLDQLRPHLANHATVAILGSSGVGKSTLINALADEAIQRTGAVRQQDSKGRHTTTHRQLIRMPGGGLIVDTPGMRELQFWDASDGASDAFAEIEQLAGACRFSDCRHAGEPGCAVTAAVTEGMISQDRLDSYHKLQRELAYLDRRQDARARAEEARRMRSITKSLRHHLKYRR